MGAETRPRIVLSSKSFSGNVVRIHVNSKGKIPSTGGSEEDVTRDAASCRTVSPTHYWLSYSIPKRGTIPGSLTLEVDVLPGHWGRLSKRGDLWIQCWAMRGVTVSTSAFLACHQCYCAGSSLAWGMNLQPLVCGIFWSSAPGIFSGYSGFLPFFIGLMVQPIR